MDGACGRMMMPFWGALTRAALRCIASCGACRRLLAAVGVDWCQVPGMAHALAVVVAGQSVDRVRHDVRGGGVVLLPLLLLLDPRPTSRPAGPVVLWLSRASASTGVAWRD